jgi:hypothetical protein
VKALQDAEVNAVSAQLGSALISPEDSERSANSQAEHEGEWDAASRCRTSFASSSAARRGNACCSGDPAARG